MSMLLGGSAREYAWTRYAIWNRTHAGHSTPSSCHPSPFLVFASGHELLQEYSAELCHTEGDAVDRRFDPL